MKLVLEKQVATSIVLLVPKNKKRKKAIEII